MPAPDTNKRGRDPSKAMKSSEESQQLRKRGNSYFLQARDSTGSRQRELLELSVSLYSKALSAAAEPTDLASAHKNIAAALAHLAQCAANDGGSSSNNSSVASEAVELLMQAIKHRCQAVVCGEAANMVEVWMNEAGDSLACVVDRLTQLLSDHVAARPTAVASALRQMTRMSDVVPEELQGVMAAALCKLLRSIKATAAGLIAPTGKGGVPSEPDWRSCLMICAESKQALIEALQLAVDCEEDECVYELLRLECDMWDMTCRCESTQARLQGDEMLQRILAQQLPAQQQQQQQQECLHGVLAVIDLYKSAALLARERDLQAEAHACSRLGHTYKVCADILNPTLQCDTLLGRSAEERSRAAFLQVLGLVDSLPHRISLMMEAWYREARDAICEYQRTTAAEETARREKEQAPIREALGEDLAALYAAADKGWLELLKHCYSTHPPINPANRVVDFSGVTADTGKEALKKAILAYHPDKQAGAGSNKKWQVLAEEITKALTRKYECFK